MHSEPQTGIETYGDPDGHGGHLSLLRLPRTGSGYVPNCSLLAGRNAVSAGGSVAITNA